MAEDGVVRGVYGVLRCSTEDQPAVRAAAGALVEELGADERVAHVAAIGGYEMLGVPGALPPVDHVVVQAWSADEGALAEAEARLRELGPTTERWTLVVEPLRVHGGADAYAPPTAGVAPLQDDEPIVVQIDGTLTPEGTGPFYESASGVVQQAFAHEAYLGGLGFTDSFMETVSFTCWRTAKGARDYAFGQGAHDVARRRDRAEGWHDSATELFLRLRPIRSNGTVLGANPFPQLATADR